MSIAFIFTYTKDHIKLQKKKKKRRKKDTHTTNITETSSNNFDKVEELIP